MSPDLRPAGRSAVLATFATLDEVVAVRAAVLAEDVSGLVEVVSGARTLLLRFDPRQTDTGRLRAVLTRIGSAVDVGGSPRDERSAAPGAGRAGRAAAGARRAPLDAGLDPLDAGAPLVAGPAPLVVPVSYDGEDLDAVSTLTGMTRRELVAWHTGQVWTSAFCGFAPGFSYLTGTAPSLDLPRRTTSRTGVPSGAVALAGEFSAVYPRSSPGGWQLIGRTEVAMWSLDRDPPALAPAGARIRFVEAGPA